MSQAQAGENMLEEGLAGVDEAGRGPLAGAVVAAAVILDPRHPVEGLADSKRLSAVRREALAGEIKARAVAWAVAEASAAEIDRHNILRASLLAMARAVRALSVPPRRVVVDGSQIPELDCPVTAVVKADQTVPAVSAASILAKVARDAAMRVLDVDYPGYGFAQNKGYPTRAHLEALARLGPTPWHRRSFAPVKKVLG
ncbi:MAG TPA: ribonuclease HII [Gammaproteobacteria bacterium]|nr:ribonuclease HII [Gammaproteobacteria bacterium]